MKNLLKFSFGGFLVLLMLAIPNYSHAGWDYYAAVSIDIMNGRTYIVSHCEDKIGDDCTNPGSATRFDVTAVSEVIQGIPMPKKL